MRNAERYPFVPSDAALGEASTCPLHGTLLKRPIIIARKDGDDAPLYLERQVRAALQGIEGLQDEHQ